METISSATISHIEHPTNPILLVVKYSSKRIFQEQYETREQAEAVAQSIFVFAANGTIVAQWAPTVKGPSKSYQPLTKSLDEQENYDLFYNGKHIGKAIRTSVGFYFSSTTHQFWCSNYTRRTMAALVADIRLAYVFSVDLTIPEAVKEQ